MHGQCKNGSCICQTGFNGKHCTLPACTPIGVRQGSLCSGHGTCDSKFAGPVGLSSHQLNTDSITDIQNAGRMSDMFTNVDGRRPEYRLDATFDC